MSSIDVLERAEEYRRHCVQAYCNNQCQGIVRRRDSKMLAENGGHVVFTKD